METTNTTVRSLAGVDCIGYVRVSTDAQAGEDRVSLADQERSITQKATALGRTVGVLFSDPGASGGTFEKRPGMMAMLAACEASPRPAKSPGLLLVMTASRFGRPDDPEDSGYWRGRFKKSGWLVRYTINDDSDDVSMRTLMRALNDVGATKERQEIKRRTTMGRRDANEKGYWCSPAPFGFVRRVCYPPGCERVLPTGVKSARGERVQLVPDPTDAAFVRRWFELYADGSYSTKGLAELARQERPERNWTDARMGDLLTNAAYVGHVRSNAKAKGTPYGKDNAHAAIVPLDVFDRAAARLSENRHVRRGSTRVYLATRLVRCSSCGGWLVGSGADKRGTRYYTCNRKLGTPCAEGGSCIAAHRLEDGLRDELAHYFASGPGRKAAYRAIDAYIATRTTAPAVPSTDPLDRSIQTLKKSIDRLVTALGNGTLTEGEAGPQLRDLRLRLTRAENERASVLRLADHRRAAQVDATTLYRVVDNLPRLLDKLTGPELREAVRLCLWSATFDRDEKRLTVGIRLIPAVADTSVSIGLGNETPNRRVVAPERARPVFRRDVPARGR